MRTPLSAILLILSWEQLRLRSYVDAAGHRTIGWGHKQHPGDPSEITREQANALFIEDLATAEEGALRHLEGVALADHEFGALVSFAFNAGVTALSTSTLLRKVRAGDASAHDEFRRWVYGGPEGHKEVVPGLPERRLAEERLFLGRGPT